MDATFNQAESDVPTSLEGSEMEPRLLFSEDEAKILALYDRLQDLRLEIAMINAQRSHLPVPPSASTPEAVLQAQSQLLDTRAKYVLRNSVTEVVMMANPILRAVHNGTDASSVERDLLPYVERRDEAALSVAQSTTEAGKLLDESTRVQAETMRVSRQNVTSTAELLHLAERVRLKKQGKNDDSEVMQEMEKLEARLKTSKQRWRVVKGVASGVVAGSGVDWMRDDALRDLVLDPEEEG